MRVELKKALLHLNKNRGLYQNGVRFDTSKWLEVIATYHKECKQLGRPISRRHLARTCRISVFAAHKAIRFARQGL